LVSSLKKEKDKLWKVKYIARSASLPSGLKKGETDDDYDLCAVNSVQRHDDIENIFVCNGNSTHQ